MDNIFPDEVIIHIYQYDRSCKQIFDQVLIQLNMHCFIHRCSECYNHYNNCHCYCITCRTCLRFCRQLYFDQNSMTEDYLEGIIPMTN